MAENKNNKVQGIIDDMRMNVVNSFIESINNDKLNWAMPWQAGFAARNGFSGKAYTGRNRMHLACSAYIHEYEDNRWTTFDAAKKAGMRLKPDQHGTRIELWKAFAIKDDDGNIDRIFTKPIRYYTVFNFDQFEDENKPANTIVAYEHGDNLNNFIDHTKKAWKDGANCPIRESKTDTEAYYKPSAHRINMPSRTLFKDGEDFVRTMLHEMTHSTGHASMLNRKDFETWGDDAYAFEELVAELGSVFAAIDLGFPLGGRDEKHFKQHAAYLKSWASHLADTPKALFDAAALAQRAADLITETVIGKSEEVQEQKAA